MTQIGAATDAQAHRVNFTGEAASYRDPATAQRLIAGVDIAALFGSFTLLFYQALRVYSEEAALLGAGFVAAELTAVSIMVLRWIRIYELDFLVRSYRGAIASAGIVAIAGGAVLLMFDASVVRLPAGSINAWLVTIAGYFASSRIVAGLWFAPLARAGAFRRRVAIVGGGEAAAKVIRALESSRDVDVAIIGLFDDRDDERSGNEVQGYRKLGGTDDLLRIAANNELDMIILAIPMTAHGRVMQLLPKFWRLPTEVRISAQAIDMKLSPRACTFLGRLPLLTVFSRPLKRNSLLVKKITDRVIASLLIVILSPVFVMAALGVALSGRGPLIVCKARAGFDGKTFHVWHFRTCKPDNPSEFTTAGRWLARYAVDELPELFNVLTGRLSIIGPAARGAHAKGEIGDYERAAASYCARHGLKPGITGWAQIHGFDGPQDTPEKIQHRVQLDLEYVDSFGPWFDLRIMAKSPFASLRNSRLDIEAG